MGLREVIADPRFQAADPEKQSVVLKRLGASDEFINKYIESGVQKTHVKDTEWGKQSAPFPGNLLGMTNADAATQGEADTLASEALPAQAKGSLEGGAMAIGGELVAPLIGAGVGAAGLSGLPRAMATGGLYGAGEELLRGGNVGRGALYGALTGGAFSKVAKLRKITDALGLTKKATLPPWQLSPGEVEKVVRGAGHATEGIIGPTAEEVAAKMVPAGELSPLSRAEMAAVVRGAVGKATAPIEVGREMTAAGELKPFSQGEAGTVVRGISKAPSGYVENPSPAMVQKFMEPATSEAKLVSDLVKAGFDPDQAREIAANVSAKGLRATTSSPEITDVPYIQEAAPAAQTAAPSGTLAERQAELLAGRPNPFATGVTAADERAKLLEQMGHGAKGLTLASIAELVRREQAKKALESQGLGVIAP